MIFRGETSSSIKGAIRGSIRIESLKASELAQSLAGGQWQFTSAIERMPNQEIRLFNISADGDAIKTRGHLVLYPDGNLKDASLLVTMEDLRKTRIPALEGTITADLKLSKWDQGTITLHSPLVEWNHQKAQNINLVLRTEKEIENWGANLDLSATILQHEWDAKCDLLWKTGESLKIDDIVLSSHLASVDGNLEIFPGWMLAGELRAQIGNLHNFDIPLYGAIDATVRLKIDESRATPLQMAEIDAKTLDFYYGDVQIQKGFFYADLSGSIEQPSGHAYIEIQQAQWKNLFLETGAVETTSAGEQWPFFFRAEGDWREPFELLFNGFWYARQSHLFLHLQNLTGSLFSRPIALPSHSEFEIGPDTLVIDDFAISIGNASIRTNVDHRQNQTDAQIKLESVPLDFLSFNPLNLSVSGLVNLDAEISEKNKKTAGTLNAELIDIQIAAIGESEPIRAKSRIAAEFANRRLQCNIDLDVFQKPMFRLSADLPATLTIYPFQPELLLEPSAKVNLSLNGQIEELLDFSISARTGSKENAQLI